MKGDAHILYYSLRVSSLAVGLRRKSSARKSVGCHFDDNVNKNEDALINIDGIISPEQSTRVKVLVLWPSGKSDVRVPDIYQKENITLLKNIALINWTAVANAVLTHSELRQDILRAYTKFRTKELLLLKFCIKTSNPQRTHSKKSKNSCRLHGWNHNSLPLLFVFKKITRVKGIVRHHLIESANQHFASTFWTQIFKFMGHDRKLSLLPHPPPPGAPEHRERACTQANYTIISYALLCYAMLCYAMLCYAMLCYAMLCYAMLCYAMLSYAMLRYAMLYSMLCYAMYAMLCYVCYAMLCTVCYAMLCYAMLYYTILY